MPPEEQLAAQVCELNATLKNLKPPPANVWRNVVIGIAATLVAGTVGWGAKSLLEHGTRITAVETVQGFLVTEQRAVREDVQEANSKLDTLIGRQDARR